MALSARDVESELQETVQQLLGRLKSHNLFQSGWDIAAFTVFFTFIEKTQGSGQLGLGAIVQCHSPDSLGFGLLEIKTSTSSSIAHTLKQH
ncbi:small integral membrane protein 22 isoform X2 [Sarcophilus harrisii]|uniref:small integral membrane protein 22 isoform X2 n=1 Tax=Sarcophilus harrisii TaxID=9305 RepID=UPI00062BB8E9|nr:small integral membrane protein 22 isoform X2 [Sarcophilus harrisii]